MSDKTVAFNGSRAEVASEFRAVFIAGRGCDKPHIEVPARLTAAWIKGVCDKEGVEKFEVFTQRRLYWQRTYEMGAHSGEWERKQIVGKFPRGGYGVFSTKVKWPGY